MYGTATAHKLENMEDISVVNPKFRSIISQPGTYTCHAAQVIANYLKPLCSNNEYLIWST